MLRQTWFAADASDKSLEGGLLSMAQLGSSRQRRCRLLWMFWALFCFSCHRVCLYRAPFCLLSDHYVPLVAAATSLGLSAPNTSAGKADKRQNIWQPKKIKTTTPDVVKAEEAKTDGYKNEEPEYFDAKPTPASQKKNLRAEEKLEKLPHNKPRELSPAVARSITLADVQKGIHAGKPILVVATNSGCLRSQESLRETQAAQSMVRNWSRPVALVVVVIEKERQLARLLKIKNAPRLRFYSDGDLQGKNYVTYDGSDMTAPEIAYWVIRHMGEVARHASEIGASMRGKRTVKGSPVGPVVHAAVHHGSPHSQLVERLLSTKRELPSKSTLFNITYVDLSEKEEFRVYRTQLPFDVEEEKFLSLHESEWEPQAIMNLMFEAENRKIFYGESPSPMLVGTRALFSVYVSQYQDLQDIALLLMEFQPQYSDRVAFHIASRTIKMRSHSADTFSHSWGGGVLIDKKGSSAAYTRAAGVVREAPPFARYAISMPFNYYSVKSFFREWENGKRELHFRSDLYGSTESNFPVMEMNHYEFFRLLRRLDRPPLGILYYEAGCPDCEDFLATWKEVAAAFSEQEASERRFLFGQVNALTNDLIDFDMRSKIPVFVIYPPISNALDERKVYSGPPVPELLGRFVGVHSAKRDEL